MPKRHWLWNLLFPQKNITDSTKVAGSASVTDPKPRNTQVAEMKERGDTTGLVKALQHQDYKIRSEAVQALIELGDAAVEPLIVLLNGENISLRQTAISILGRSRETRAIETLCRMLNDEDGYIHYEAKRVLEAKPDPRMAAPLIQAAQAVGASVHVFTTLRLVLDQTADKIPSEVLRQAAQMNDSYVMIYAQVDTSCTFRTYNVTRDETDFTQIKQMARQELIRRGLEA